jgi:alkylhydroperoxidase family enzyme
MLTNFLSLIMKAPAEPETRLPPTTLTYLLQAHKVPVETLIARHGAVATIAKSLLGVVPNTGKYFEIWPPANKMYYFMVPSFLNLPAFMFGYGAPKELISLALYTSSLAACCPYCSSHTCTFSVRRGVEVEKLSVQAICARQGATNDLYTPVEKSVMDMSELLATFPCKVRNKDRANLLQHAGNPETAEAIVLGMAMMGYLNKSMDALGMPLEVETYRETRNVIGETWSPGASGQLVDPDIHTPEPAPAIDSFATYWSMVKQGPSAANFEKKASPLTRRGRQYFSRSGTAIDSQCSSPCAYRAQWLPSLQ